MAKKTIKDADGNYNYIRKSFRYQGQLFTVRGKTEREAKEKCTSFDVILRTALL